MISVPLAATLPITPRPVARVNRVEHARRESHAGRSGRDARDGGRRSPSGPSCCPSLPKPDASCPRRPAERPSARHRRSARCSRARAPARCGSADRRARARRCRACRCRRRRSRAASGAAPTPTPSSTRMTARRLTRRPPRLLGVAMRRAAGAAQPVSSSYGDSVAELGELAHGDHVVAVRAEQGHDVAQCRVGLRHVEHRHVHRHSTRDVDALSAEQRRRRGCEGAPISVGIPHRHGGDPPGRRGRARWRRSSPYRLRRPCGSRRCARGAPRPARAPADRPSTRRHAVEEDAGPAERPARRCRAARQPDRSRRARARAAREAPPAPRRIAPPAGRGCRRRSSAEWKCVNTPSGASRSRAPRCSARRDPSASPRATCRCRSGDARAARFAPTTR